MDDRVKEFFRFTLKRQTIWHRKSRLGLPPPWTDDAVLRQFHFCNVFREADKGTQYIINHVCHNPCLSPEDKVFNIVAYRFFNILGFFDTHTGGLLHADKFDPEHYITHLNERRERGDKMFHMAYRVCPIPIDRERDPSIKHVQVLLVLDKFRREQLLDGFVTRLREAESAEASFNQIKIHTVGMFLGYEMWQDFSYCRGELFQWSDDDFVTMGPGAKAGVELMLVNEYPEDDLAYLRQLRDDQEEYWAALKEEGAGDWNEVAYPGGSRGLLLSLGNVEQALCEYRKWLNLSAGGGRHRLYKTVTV